MTDLIVISDIHFHSWKAFSDGTGASNSRFQQTLGVVRESLNLARNKDKIWICAGDVLHTTGYASHPIAGAVLDLFEEYSDVTKLFVFGNHDGRGQGGEVFLNETFLYTVQKAVPNAVILDNDSYQIENGPTVYGFGAQNNTKIVEEAIREVVGVPPADIIVGHQMVIGSKFASGISAENGMHPDFLYEWANLSIFGDVHQPTLDKRAGKAILVPGSPEHHNFGDHGGRGYWVVTMEEKEDHWYPVNFEDIESDSPKFITVEDSSEIEPDDNNFYRVLHATNKDVIPENATVVKSSPDVVETRDLLEDAHSQREILERWIELNEPDGRFPNKYLDKGLQILQRQDDVIPRNARIKRVEGKNFFSYESLEYDIEKGVHLIVGKSNHYQSNGSGKSSLLELIFWILFGKTTKGVSAADVIRWDADECFGRLEIDLEGKELVIERSRTTSSINLQVWIDGKEQTAETNTALSNKLESLIGWTPDLFKALGYFSQEDLVLLSRSTDSELKNTLADLRGLSAYQDAAEESGDLYREKREEVNNYSFTVNTLSDEIKRDNENIKKYKEKAESWEKEKEQEIKQKEQELDKQKEQTQTLEYRQETVIPRILERASRLVDQAKERQKEIVETKTEQYLAQIIAGKEEQKKTYQEKLEEASEKLGSASSYEIEDIISLIDKKKDEFTNYGSDIKTINNAIVNIEKRIPELRKSMRKDKDRLESIGKEERCPTCGQVISSGESSKQVVDSIQEDIDGYEEEIEKLTSEKENKEKEKNELIEAKKKAEEQKDKLVQIRSLLEDVNKYEKLIKEIEDKKKSAKETAKARAERDANNWFNKRENRIKERVSQAKTFIDNKIQKAEQRITYLENELNNIKAKENPHNIAIENLKDNRQARKSDRWRAYRRQREAEEAQEIFWYWQNAFGKSGIQSLLIEDIAALFNKYRGMVFPTLTRGVYDVQMSATSKTQAGEVREKTEYRVFQEGQEIPYEALSGGQRRRIDLGVLLTTTLAASKAHGVPGALGLLILDEVASYLDEDGAEALAETLEEYCPEIVPTTFVVSQDLSHRSLYDKIIMVEQDENGISRIVN